jgi:iron complex transport system permease protein
LRRVGEEAIDSIEVYRKGALRKWILLTLSMVLLLVVLVVSLSIGSSDLTIHEAFKGLIGKGDDVTETIIWRIRLPRIITSIIAGAGLAAAGAAMQTVLRNPIGSPVTLGISQAAAFGAAFAVVVLGAGTLQSGMIDAVVHDNIYLVSACAFAASMVSTGVIILLARFKRASPESMILTGVAMGSLATAGTTAMEYFADDVQLSSIIFWTFGDMGRTGWEEIAIISIVVIPAITYFSFNGWRYNALDMGDETASSLGVDTERLRLLGMGAASLVTAFIISFVGIIGFVGLVVPHIVRKLIGPDQRYLMPASVIFGALLLLISDTVARTVISPVVLPVGILTSFLGAPLFIYLVIRGREHW